MNNTNIISSVGSFDFGRQVGWKYYNQIRKKAMEQEFSWSGFIISMSIAFFIVIFSALMLNTLSVTAESKIFGSQTAKTKIYKLENFEYNTLLQTNSKGMNYNNLV